jgi:hypothetical protein
MNLESYACDMWIWQYEESILHLFTKCNRAKVCWESIGIVLLPQSNNRKRVIMMLKRRIAEPFFMEVTILMTWAIWSTRNGWIFENQDPSVSGKSYSWTYQSQTVGRTVRPLRVAVGPWELTIRDLW